MTPTDILEYLANAHSWSEYSGHVGDHDGSTRLDVLVAEAVARARLIWRRAHGLPSPTQEGWEKNIAKPWKEQASARPRIREALSAAEYPMTWQQLMEIVLPEASDEMRRRCWFGYRITLEIGSKPYERAVYESQATHADRNNPRVLIVPDATADHVVNRRGAISFAAPLYEFYQTHGTSLRQKIARARGKSGGRKTQRQLKKDDQRGEIV